ncbi:hypothetical protein HIM_02991 [Hirsutella minnesotensis 3608]|nr:hypothetical protein HIM_02991 [Hirsutella minnesotensis 3608]
MPQPSDVENYRHRNRERAMEKPEERFGIKCPAKSNFYVCSSSKSQFIGCCSINPCDRPDGDCPQDKLEATSFYKSAYNLIPPQDCVGESRALSDALWYTCAATDPPFMGCCTENPCKSSAGCPKNSVRAASLSTTRDYAAPFLGLPIESAPKPSASSASSSTSSATATFVHVHTTLQAGATSTGKPTGSSGLSSGSVAGISIGATAAAVMIFSALFFWLKRRSSQNSQQDMQWPPPPPGPHGQASPYPGQQYYTPDMRTASPAFPSRAMSPCASPETMHQSPYQGYRTPPMTWNTCDPLPVNYEGQQYPGQHMSAELSSEAGSKPLGEKLGASPETLHGGFANNMSPPQPAHFAPAELDGLAPNVGEGGRTN